MCRDIYDNKRFLIKKINTIIKFKTNEINLHTSPDSMDA